MESELEHFHNIEFSHADRYIQQQTIYLGEKKHEAEENGYATYEAELNRLCEVLVFFCDKLSTFY